METQAIMPDLWTLLRRVRKDHYTPEEYAGAGGELLILTVVVCWALTFIFNPATIESNSLKDRVGYNNLCVGWDSFPARAVAPPLFALIIWMYIQYMNYGLLRQNLTAGLTMRQRAVVYVANCVTGLSYCAASLIFVFDQRLFPVCHSVSFIQLQLLSYCAFAANMLETDPAHHPPGSHVYLVILGLVSFSFTAMATYQLIAYDEKTGKRGPIPWYVCAMADYLWFSCRAVIFLFRPRAPSIRVRFELASTNEFTVVPAMEREVPKNIFSRDMA
mmetsp:Transcript_93590/g.260583  ORF Transcript_93590/g.260583 Transcript_93590/m.260583 type:complete len:274 (+) Transcript_93590:86-907(+)